MLLLAGSGLTPIQAVAARPLPAGIGPDRAAATATAPAFSLLQSDKPYVPTLTQISGCNPQNPPYNLSGPGLDALLAQLTRWYVHIHGESSNAFPLGSACQGSLPNTLASILAAKGIAVSNYRNGSYTSQGDINSPLNFGEAADLEANAPLAIGSFWPGDYSQSTTNDNSTVSRLPAALDATSTIVSVASAAAVVPPGSPPTWPYVNSRGTGSAAGAHSNDTFNFVSWIRIDNEMMQIVADPVAGANLTLTVRRGIFGTVPAAHAATSRVLSPVYIGANDAVPADIGLDGSPSRADPNYPLRYDIKFGTPAGYKWIAGRISTTFGAGLQGYNGVWLDVSACWPYDLGAADHNSVAAWDDVHATHTTSTQWAADQKTKLAGLRAALPGVAFQGNNLAEYGRSTCNDDLMSNGYDAGVLENWAVSGWPTTMSQSFRNMQNNWPAIYWARWDNVPPAGAAAYQRFAYASMLLTYRSTATKMVYGGPWAFGRPDPLYFWNLGAPNGTPAALTDVAVAGISNFYQRDFANATVFVNSGATPVSYTLPTTYYDLVNLDTSGNPSPVTSITVGPSDAAFLLKATAGSGVYAPAAWYSSPKWTQSVSLGNLAMTGNAGSRTGVSAVEIGIQQTSSGLWWQPDGSWGPFTAYPATLGTPGAGRTTWSFTWPLAQPGAYSASVRAYDINGYAQLIAQSRPFNGVDTVGPATTLDKPADGSILPLGGVTSSGTASDNIAVASVAVSVQNLDDGTFFHADGTWGTAVSNPATVVVNGTQATWSFPWTPLVGGDYEVQATATDTGGNLDPAPPTAVYTIDSAAPTVTIVTPVANQTFPVGLPAVFTGTVADDAAIKNVTVGIKNQTTKMWLQANGSWGTGFAGLTAVLALPGASTTTWTYTWTPRITGSFLVSVGAIDSVNLQTTNRPTQQFKIA